MRRTLCAIVTLTILFCLMGCTRQEITFEKPVEVFFCQKDIAYNTDNGVIVSETWEYSNWEEKPRDFLNFYLSGTQDPDLTSPFPLGGWIIKLEQTDNLANLLVNTVFSRLSPSELTLCCACLSMTVMELMDVDTVNIQIDGTGQEVPAITMTRDNLSFADNALIN